MGLLDEAIREHLELKRRRGADPTEVSRQEQEAFGAARRGEFAAPEPAAAVAAEHTPEVPEPALDEPAAVAAQEPPTALRAVGDAPQLEVQEEPPRPHGDPADALPDLDPQATQAFDAEEVRAATTPPPREPDPEPPAPELAAEPLAPAPPPPPAPSVPEPEPVVPEPGAARPEEDPAEEDVLEETPEFLQETPEHDRLWFEQRPPRDFDF